MRNGKPSVIKLLGEPLLNEEGVATEAGILPGMLVQGITDIAAHASAAGFAPTTFALERSEMGDDIETEYTIGDAVKVGYFKPGDRVNAILASGENVNEGDLLNSNGDGKLQAGSSNAVGRALEDTDASSGDARIRVEVV